MNVSHEQDLKTEEAVVRVLRAARANDAAALPTRHAQRTDQCVPISRVFAYARLGAKFTAGEQQHYNGCAFCQHALRSFYTPTNPAASDETTVISSSEETMHFDTPPKRKPPTGGAPPA